MTSDDIVASIDLARFGEIRTRYKHNDDRHSTKYFDLKTWIPRNWYRAIAVGLVNARPCRVLDVGCGMGYFAYVCRKLGHEAVALDRSHRPRLYRDVNALLDISIVEHDVMPFVSLPETGMFDVITAHMVTFNGHLTERVWSSHEWKFWLDDARSRLLPGGCIYLELNNEPTTGSCYTPGLRAYFESHGADISGHAKHIVRFGAAKR